MGCYDNKIMQVMGHSHAGKNFKVRLRPNNDSNQEVIVNACAVYGIKLFSEGDIVSVNGFGNMEVLEHAYDDNGNLVYRVSTVVYANEVNPK